MSDVKLSRRAILGGAAAVTVSLSTGALGQAQARRRPNILFVMADDLGYADLSCFGRRDYETPRLDRLAEDGLMLTHSYASSAVCSPTRVGLMTGRYQYRLPIGLEEPLGFGVPGVGLDPDHPTLPSLLKDAGYRTSLVGKWHLGYLPDYSPLLSGYDSFFGIFPGGATYFTHEIRLPGTREPALYEDDVPVERIGYMTDLLTDRAVQEVHTAAERDEPFFISLHYTAPHWPWEGPNDQERAEDLRNMLHFDGGTLEIYADMVRSMDEGIGRVLDAVDAVGATGDTLVVFTSDNGGERFSDNWPFIGVKGELLEGGIRVPTIVRWPGRIDGGRESAQVNSSIDWLPTLLAAAGAEPDPDYAPDGLDLMPILLGERSEEPRKLFWRFRGSDQAAVREGRWKYLRLGGHEYLFDIVADARERANLSQRHPERFARLRADYEAWNATMLPYPDGVGGYVVPQANHADRY